MALYEAVLQTQHKDEIITLTLIYQMKFNATLANINKDAATTLISLPHQLNVSHHQYDLMNNYHEITFLQLLN